MGIVNITDETQFQDQLNFSGNKLVVAYFYALWSPRCYLLRQAMDRFATEFTNANFLKVDIDLNRELAVSHRLPCVPTTVLYKEREELDRYNGNDLPGVEERIRLYYDNENETTPEGQMDLLPLIQNYEILNAADENHIDNFMSNRGSFIESDTDKQLIISIYFSEEVKVHSLRFKAPSYNGPKNVKLFINQLMSPGFDDLQAIVPTQSLEVESNKLVNGQIIQLQCAKFQTVRSLIVYIEDNHEDNATTRLNHLQVFGTPNGTVSVARVNLGGCDHRCF